MRFAPIIAFAVAALASPALATGGFTCRPVSGAGPSIQMSFGHTIAARPMAINLREGRRTLSTAGARPALLQGQSWMDDRHLWLDLVDTNATRYEARLRAEFRPRLPGRPAIGTLVRNGRTYRVRCLES